MEETAIVEALRLMEHDPSLVTDSAYRANAEHWPDHRISFKEVHLLYLKTHPAVNPSHYLSNLRLMLRKKP